jgi:hypothetical protein
MASTRNKNTGINYKLEQRSYQNQDTYTRLYGESYETHLSGNGLLHGRLPREQLSANPINTESFLFGINSTNLVSQTPIFEPKLNTLQDVHLFNKETIYMPEPFICETGQRPLYK